MSGKNPSGPGTKRKRSACENTRPQKLGKTSEKPSTRSTIFGSLFSSCIAYQCQLILQDHLNILDHLQLLTIHIAETTSRNWGSNCPHVEYTREKHSNVLGIFEEMQVFMAALLASSIFQLDGLEAFNLDLKSLRGTLVRTQDNVSLADITTKRSIEQQHPEATYST